MPASTKTTSKKPNKRTRKPQAASGSTPKAKSSGATRSPAKRAPKLNNYAEAKAWLFGHVDHERARSVSYDERTFGLDRMRKLLAALGDPHEQIKAVHVAGTKGKGSTCGMTASMLTAAGYTTGLYSSPHLSDLRERITIDGQMVSYPATIELFQQIAKAEVKTGLDLTFFEIMTAAAFLHFAEQAVDLAVLEVGLGGRLDCTNVCVPLVTAVTSISLDHTAILGDSVELIAKEKAGIFKSAVPAITCEQEVSVRETLKAAAEEADTQLEISGKDIDFSYRFEANRELGPHTRVCLTTPHSKFEHLAVPLKGEHQAHNAGLALSIIDKLRGLGYAMDDDKIIAGLDATYLPGRMEEVWQAPRVILDGAHNAASLQALFRALGSNISYDSLVLVFGCGEDKDISGMLKQASLGADKVIFTKAKSNPRAMEPDHLIKRFAESTGKMAQTAKGLESALGLAARAVSRDDLIVVAGSFYLVGEGREYFHKLEQKRRG